MKKSIVLMIVGLGFSVFTGCQKTGDTWDNVKTAGRYLNRSIDALIGKDYDSQMLSDSGDFRGPGNEEFVPLMDEDLKTQFRTTDMAIAQPKHAPGEHGIPAMYQFKEPSGQLNSIFRNMNFDTDDHVLRNHEDLVLIQKISEYMKKHPNAYLSVEGHTDERASAAYNMALGTRRANHIRVLLIKNGVDFNRIYTISYGKEKPAAHGHAEDAWRENRRVQYKLYHK